MPMSSGRSRDWRAAISTVGTALFDERADRGLVLDGHGDLLADDIFCLPDGPRILDCIEFDARLRYGDVLSDLAFLAMDLERLGTADLGSSLLAWYSEFSGEDHPATLAHYYIAARALIRSKVSCIRAGQGDDESRTPARALLDLALAHLRRAEVRLVVVGGAPGTGKSTLAHGLGTRLGWVVLGSDAIRKDVAGIGRGASAAARYREGIYAPELTEATYRALLERAEIALRRGESVILDASWSDASRRAAASDLARATASALVELRCDVSAPVAAVRVAGRTPAMAHDSDADAQIAAVVRTRFDVWPTAHVVSTLRAPEVVLDVAQAIAMPW